jgi:hypothetical protein
MNALQKFYLGLWGIFVLAIMILVLTGSITSFTLTVLGFTCFGLIFMGMICVLPTTVGRVAPMRVAEATPAKRKIALRTRLREWFRPIGIEVRHP